MACTFVGVKGDFWKKRAPFVCPKQVQSSRRNPTYHFTPYILITCPTGAEPNVFGRGTFRQPRRSCLPLLQHGEVTALPPSTVNPH